MKKYWFLILTIFVGKICYSQSLKNENFRFGLGIGSGLYYLSGDALNNTRIKAGANAMVYYKLKLGKKGLQFFTAAHAGFKGSNYKNNDNELTKLALSYVDIPINLMLAFDKNYENNIFLGPYFSYLISRDAFRGSDIRPTQSELKIPRYDIGVNIGYWLAKNNAGMLLSLKTGFVNLNDNLFFKDFGPQPKADGTLFNQSLEILIMF